MKKKTWRRIALGALATLLAVVLTHYPLDENSHKEENNEPKPFSDTLYDLTTKDIEEEEPSKTEIELQKYLDAENLRSEDEVLSFFSVVEKQFTEYINNYDLKRSKDGVEYLWEIVKTFSVKREEFHGVYYNDLSNKTRQELTKIFMEIHYMYVNKETKEKAALDEVCDNVTIIAKDFVHGR